VSRFNLETALRLETALLQVQKLDTFVYFGTCSVGDPEAQHTPYVQHKLAMEQLAATHPRYLILRLPQVVGITPNPHTLSNYFYTRIARSESFQLWRKAKRNIIDVDDVAAIAGQLIPDPTARRLTLNIANSRSDTIPDIVASMERVVGKKAIYESVDRGSEYAVDTRAILPMLDKAGVKFGGEYLERVMGKYYAKAD
jgi:nucleoside-diphosphate-sugar epimerase